MSVIHETDAKSRWDGLGWPTGRTQKRGRLIRVEDVSWLRLNFPRGFFLPSTCHAQTAGVSFCQIRVMTCTSAEQAVASGRYAPEGAKLRSSILAPAALPRSPSVVPFPCPLCMLASPSDQQHHNSCVQSDMSGTSPNTRSSSTS